MTFSRGKIKDFYLLTTDVENMFINEYLPEAPGEYPHLRRTRYLAERLRRSR